MEEAFEGGAKYTLYLIEYCAPPLPSEMSVKSPNTESQADTSDQLQHFQVSVNHVCSICKDLDLVEHFSPEVVKVT